MLFGRVEWGPLAGVITCKVLMQAASDLLRGRPKSAWLSWSGHVTRRDGLSKFIPHGTLETGRRHSMPAEEMLNGRVGVDVPIHSRTAHDSLQQNNNNNLEEAGSLLNCPW